MPIDCFDAEGQHQSPAAGRALEAPDALSKLLNTGTGNGRIHGFGNGLGWLYVPYLFSFAKREGEEPMSFFAYSSARTALAPTLALRRASEKK
jgi:hypothetical protein